MTPAPAKFPGPPAPASLAAVGVEVTSFSAGTRLWRVYSSGGAHAGAWNTLRAFGPTDARFDHQDPPPHLDAVRMVAYAGEAAPLAIAERFAGNRRVDRQAGVPRLAGFALTAAIGVADLRGLWPTRAGASQAVSSGPRTRSRRWARAIWEATDGDVDGLAYRSSMYGGLTAVALWERARAALPADPILDIALDDPALLVPLARATASIGYTLR